MRHPSREVHKPAVPRAFPALAARVQRGARGGGGAAGQEAPAQVITAFAPARFSVLLRLVTSC